MLYAEANRRSLGGLRLFAFCSYYKAPDSYSVTGFFSLLCSGYPIFGLTGIQAAKAFFVSI
jgi:hypothetical protein